MVGSLVLRREDEEFQMETKITDVVEAVAMPVSRAVVASGSREEDVGTDGVSQLGGQVPGRTQLHFQFSNCGANPTEQRVTHGGLGHGHQLGSAIGEVCQAGLVAEPGLRATRP